ncbi:ubiquitin-conjugating enzyme E2 Z [Rhipicephalus sanguineus]|uniref:ubiquitin-conjugating enzyme E2 Z n=1 Tax=Rhipicephalus sanguineus TaxID=34632 RepID=UPI00189475CF|nr:ubiquitin-conjugating enzyme E2 Z [Rhipicephalus sanguineus]
MSIPQADPSKTEDRPFIGVWDPLTCVDEIPTPSCLSRIRQELSDIEDNPLPGIFVCPEDNDITRIHSIIIGPAETPYEGGFFHVFVKCPAAYPAVPPHVRLMTTDAGKICLGIVGTGPGPVWTHDKGIGSVLMKIQLLLSDVITPTEAYSSVLKDKVRHDTVRVAVCDAVAACLHSNPPYPSRLARVMMKTFTESYDRYEDQIKALGELESSRNLAHMLGVSVTYLYQPLMSRLKNLGQEVKDKIQPSGGLTGPGSGGI